MKKIIALVLIVVVTLAAVLVSHLNQQSIGHLSVQTNDDKAKITVLGPSFPNQANQVGTGSASIDLKAGEYLIEATSGNSVSRSNATVKAKTTTYTTLTLTKSLSPAYTINYSASNLSLSGSSIKFLNQGLQQIYEQDSSRNIEQAITPDLYPVTKLSWVNHQQAYAVVNTLDLYYVDNNTSTIVNTPQVSGDNQTIMDMDTNSSGDLVYAKAGHIFRQLHSEGDIKQIGTYDTSKLQTAVTLRLAINGTVLVSTFVDHENAPPTSGNAYFVKPTGEQVKYPGSDIIQQAEWSPDSQRLAISTYNNLVVYDYLKKDSSTIVNHAINPIGGFNWISNNQLLYVDQGIIWQSLLGQATSNKLATVPGTIYQTAPFISTNPKTVYFSTVSQDTSGAGAAIYKISM